jgi:membrane peptidoglycan carboxypeptidase
LRRRKRRLITLFVLIPLFFFLAGTAYFIYTYATIDLTRQLEEPSIILDRNGKQVSRFSSEIRQVVSLEEMSPYLLQAFIAIEDSRFYQHFGLDPRGLARALWHNLRKGKIVEGGSTITQQLAENEYFIGVSGPARSLGKKIEEAIYAIKLERTYTKDEILERYLNRIYFGHGRFGVEAASQYYFGKSAADLSLSEAAMLAGIPNAPAVYSLRDNPDNAHARRNLVLARMEELGYISAAEREEAEAQVLTPAPPQEKTASANHFRQRVEKELRSIFSRLYPAMSDKEITNLIYNQGLTIHTTLSLEAQAAAEKVMTEHGQALRQKNPNIQGVFVALDPATGGIMALVESLELSGTYPRADAKYNLGSSFKGILYATALENGYTPASTLLCTETAFPNPGGKPNPYVPSDYGDRFHNRMLRIREALAVSCNVAAVRMGVEMGLDKYLDMVARLNPRLKNNPIGNAAHMQLPLGPVCSPLNLTLAYAPFANGGYSVEPYTVTEVSDRDGAILYQAWPKRQPVLDPRLAYIVTDMLKGVPSIRQVAYAAGKTGTSDTRNAVFVGFTTDIVATVFFGFDTPAEATFIGSAAAVATPAWRDFAAIYYGESPPADFSRPPGVEDAVICSETGQLATYLCPHTLTEIFMPGTAPREYCPVHAGESIEICTSTGLPANQYCPRSSRVTVEREAWMRNLQCWFHGPPQESEEVPEPEESEEPDAEETD